MAEIVGVDTREYAMQRHVGVIGGPNTIAIFDFGTRGVRLIVGPKRVPLEIGEHTFQMEGQAPNVGLDVVRRILPPNARSLFIACRFIRHWRDLLWREGVRDVHLLSTAWFRWLENREKIRKIVKARTKLSIEMIEQQREAELTLLSLPVLHERWRGARKPPPIGDNDTVALIDQGGGSLQISWMRWRDRSNKEVAVETSRFPDLGSVARRRDFFRLNAEEKEINDPLKNNAGIAKQVERTRTAARKELAKDQVLPTVRGCAPGKLHIFAVGSAITDIAPDGVFNRHNFQIPAATIDQKLAAKMEKLNADREQVRSIWRGMRLPASQQTDASRVWFERKRKLDEILTSLFGLPVYREVLAQTGCDGLTVSGYGLSYGYYFSKCLINAPVAAGNEPDDRGPYVFISYSRDDSAEVEVELDQLRGMRTRFWYDRELAGGDRFTKRIADKIVGSAALVVFVTPNSIKSEWVRKEVEFAVECGRTVVPIVLQQVRLPNDWRLALVSTDQVQRFAMEPDRYLAKLQASIPLRCRRTILPAAA
jgi:hypothetical protein